MKGYEILKELIIKANTELPQPVLKLLQEAYEKAEEKNIKRRLQILLENAEIARKEKKPICQDTGLLNVFLFLPEGARYPEGFEDTLNKALYDAYFEGGFRFSTVNPPINGRKNPKTNKPPFLKIIPSGFAGKVRIVAMPKGAGSENVSFVKMFKPTTASDLLIDELVKLIVKKIRFSCPPVILGISIGGTFDSAPLKAKLSLLEAGKYETELGKAIAEKINLSEIGPFGLGGFPTVLSACISLEPTHIASLPVAVNFSCHALRYAEAEFTFDEWESLEFEVL